jgi:hypothetical protein
MDGLSTNQGPGASSPWTWPLGGDVTQWIRTTWIKALSDQTGFININNVRAGDPEVERRIIEDVASYGRQLGRIMEALDVVIGHLRLGERTDVTADERRAAGLFGPSPPGTGAQGRHKSAAADVGRARPHAG